jgi:lauroyl/myristoyl acyltransferase
LSDQRFSFRHRLEYLTVRSIVAVTSLLPMRLVLGLGSLLGWAFYALDGPHRRLARRNLEAAFPTRTGAERRAGC